MNKSSRIQGIQRIVIYNLISSFIAQIKMSMLDVFLRFLHPLRQRIALLRSAKRIFVRIKFIVSDYDRKGSTELASAESICLDVKSSFMFSSGCFVLKAFAFQRLKFRLYFNNLAHFPQECRKGILNFIMS